MTLDVLSISLMTALVGVVAAVVFISETLRRHDTGAGRLWALAFFCGGCTTLAYASWAAGVGDAVAVAAGNTFFVLTPAFMWLAHRRYNDRRLAPQAVVVGILATVTMSAALLQYDTLGDWGGWVVEVVCLVVLFWAAGYEATRLPMRRLHSARIVAGVLLLAGAYYAVRVVVYLVEGGPDGPLFSTWFGSVSANVVTVVLTVTIVVSTSVLRATKSNVQRYEWLSDTGVAADGLMVARTYRGALVDVIERAGWRRELVSVVVVRIDGLDEMGRAFGSAAVDDITAAWRQAVRRHAPAAAFVGEDGDGTLAVCSLATTAADARRQAAVIYRGCVDELSDRGRGLLPVLGVGVALTETLGYDAAALLDAARAASLRAARQLEASVLFGGIEDVKSRLT